MHYRTLGSSGLKVSSLCLGTMMFGDRTELPEARNIVASAIAGGVNFIDTADVYKRGASETMLGEAIRDSRSHWVLATKVGNRMSSAPNESGYSRTWIMRAIEASLKRLQTDYVDLYQFHSGGNKTFQTPGLWEMLNQQVEAGKVRHLGISIGHNGNLV